MYSFNYTNNSRAFSSLNIITTSSIDRLLNKSKYQKRQQNTTITYTTTSFISNITSLSSSTIQYQQSSFDEPYSVKTGIKIAALLGGMLLFVIIYLIWKARRRLYHFLSLSRSNINNPRLSANKFDLDYWLKQVDLLEAKEIERNRGDLSPYLELPTEEPRDNQLATASWIIDACHQWRLIQYRQQHQLLQQTTNQQTESNIIPYRRRRHILRRFIRRLLIPAHQHPSYLDQHLSSLIADLRPSIVNNNLIPPLDTLNIPPRRVVSWPRLKSTHHQNGTMMSTLEAQNARKYLLKQIRQTNTLNKYEKKF
ncbi:unnamed protein product [Rotaria sp. Silwood1]|nr:unnamed protein product [Rotaria sp. Silwood1]CAF3679060.1 unnamed protein product [Rotaria sp. Silwood1]CAF4548134.1 unnamed protein product [Rotaria sp. Silwood1]CAF4883630.1 unnamed protein product [Rotaria sp. Silwood1]